MDSEAILALLSDLVRQVMQLTQEVMQLTQEKQELAKKLEAASGVTPKN